MGSGLEALVADASRDLRARAIRRQETAGNRRWPARSAVPTARLVGRNRSWGLMSMSTPHGDGGSCVEPSCYRVPPGHSFLHIPKTGGTGIEQSAKALGIEVLTSPLVNALKVQRSGQGQSSPWHLPPDMFERVYGTPRSSNGRPLLCVVRDPVVRRCPVAPARVCKPLSPLPERAAQERLRSEASWRCTPAIRKWLNPRLKVQHDRGCRLQDQPEFGMTSDAEEVLRAPRRVALVHMGDRVLHILPQSWFVWAEDGSVQCSCVVAYDKLARVLGLEPKKPSNYADVRCPRTPAFAALYAVDEELHANASADRALCYRPRPLPIRRMEEDNWRLWQRRQRRLCWRTRPKSGRISVE